MFFEYTQYLLIISQENVGWEYSSVAQEPALKAQGSWYKKKKETLI